MCTFFQTVPKEELAFLLHAVSPFTFQGRCLLLAYTGEHGRRKSARKDPSQFFGRGCYHVSMFQVRGHLRPMVMVPWLGLAQGWLRV